MYFLTTIKLAIVIPSLTYHIVHFSKGLLFLCHGYGEHLEWYGELAAHLASEKHLLVFGHDHIGHGLSDGERAVVGNLDEVYVNDVFLHVFTVRAGEIWFIIFMSHMF